MDRRKVLGYLSAIGLCGFYGTRLFTSDSPKPVAIAIDSANQSLDSSLKTSTKTKNISSSINSESHAQAKIVTIKNNIKDELTRSVIPVAESPNSSDSAVVDYLYKIQNFDNNYNSDFFLDSDGFFVLKRLSRRLNRAQTIIGYMNFSILDFPLLLRYSKNYPAIGKFTQSELDLIEQLVFRSASDYGFFGEKLISNLNYKVSKQQLSKISGSGQYLYKDQAFTLFNRIKRDVGEQVVLTSGVRGLMKQLQLFCAKAVKTEGNLSRASRSLAPPGHSYHGIGDFDIGDIKLGKLNFTEKFSDTTIYKKLTDLGYIKIRYQTDNQFGVRYEPWHIKVS